MALRLRLRGPSGKQHSCSWPAEPPATLAELRREAAEAFSLPEAQVEVLLGFPPALCTAAGSTALSSLVRSGDAAVVRLATGGPASQATSSEAFSSVPAALPSAVAAAAMAPAPTGGPARGSVSHRWACAACTLENEPSATACGACETPNPAASGHAQHPPAVAGGLEATLVPMADDNSCLFHGIAYLLEPAAAPAKLRQMIASEVRANPVQWDAATLGKPREEYIAYIMDPIRWGGQVELAIFSAAYGAEIAVVQVQNGRADVYGEGAGYRRRVYLLHSGIHFDAVVFGPGGTLREVGAADVAKADEAARRLAEQRRSAGQFVDHATMRLRCKICGFIAEGDLEARQHSGSMGHKEFAPA